MNGSLPKSRRPWGEALASFIICLALGPPIGGLIFAIGLVVVPALDTMAGLKHGLDLSGGLYAVLILGLFAMPFSYMVGGIQAGAAGLLFALWGWNRGRPPFVVALVISGLVFAGALMAGVGEVPEFLPVLAAIHVVPTAICWLVIRNLWPERRT